MSGKLANSPSTWVDPDDVPELDDTFFKDGTYIVDGKPVSAEEGKTAMRKARGRPVVANKKRTVTIRLAPEVIERWRASGKGWQRLANPCIRSVREESAEVILSVSVLCCVGFDRLVM